MKKVTKKALYFPFDDRKIESPKPQEGKKYLLYIHVPFCKTLCPYCSFNRFKFCESTTREYFLLLKKEIKIAKSLGFDFCALYVGGGTTTILPDELARIIDFCKEEFSIKEVTREGDPNIDDFLITMLQGRVDRLSIGVQAFDDDMLKKIARYKKFGSSKEQFSKIKKAIGKFPIVNIDLIFNLPAQSEEMLRKDLQTAKELNPDQITIYPLMYSPSVKSRIQKSMGKVENKNESKLYKLILKELGKGYKNISTWSFSKRGKEIFDEYVVDYDEYLGLGSGSFSFIGNELYINHFSLKEYEKMVKKGSLSIQRSKSYTKFQMLHYRLMVDFFGESFSKDYYRKNFSKPLNILLNFELTFMRLFGLIEGEYKTTRFGKYFFLVLMKEFYIGMDYVREISRQRLTKDDTKLAKSEQGFGFVNIMIPKEDKKKAA